jgi:hypothetical protein
MDDLHDRCQRLQSLLQSIDPSIDVEDHIALDHVLRPCRHTGGGTRFRRRGMNQCKFEWQDGNPTHNDAGAALADGMAGLNIDSKVVAT